ncbi:MAG: dTDP-4-dehydrorhamnose 3,5-epimerase [Methanomassiliicoccales archaeon]|nr:dTDP-4-dehydrorhamnose 3,5-epimerase [Methanomassiliicoccales archaeon]
MSRPTVLPEIIVVEPKVFKDGRGYFYESYSVRNAVPYGIGDVFVQDNHSYSVKKGVIRGLHYQRPPFAQTKLVRCTSGSVLDVAVDIRYGSKNYAKWFGIVLSAENKKQLYIPRGFAHGFLTLQDDCEVQYKVDNFYSAEHDRGVRYDDKDIGVEWGVSDPLLSDKDANAPFLKDCKHDFTWSGKQ